MINPISDDKNEEMNMNRGGSWGNWTNYLWFIINYPTFKGRSDWDETLGFRIVKNRK